MFYQFGLFSLRRFTPSSPLLQFQACREILSRRAPTHSSQFRIPPTARTITTSIGLAASRFNSAQIISLKAVVLTGCVGLGLAMSLTRSPIYCDSKLQLNKTGLYNCAISNFYSLSLQGECRALDIPKTRSNVGGRTTIRSELL